jgi:hypothetical protein
MMNNPHATTASQVPGEYSIGPDSRPKTESDALGRATHRHYKGGLYAFVLETTHSETGETLVVRNHVWPHEPSSKAVPKELFYGTVEGGGLRYTPLKVCRVEQYIPMFVDQGVGNREVAYVEKLEDIAKLGFVQNHTNAKTHKQLTVLLHSPEEPDLLLAETTDGTFHVVAYLSGASHDDLHKVFPQRVN